jgi:hypothetical protein
VRSSGLAHIGPQACVRDRGQAGATLGVLRAEAPGSRGRNDRRSCRDAKRLLLGSSWTGLGLLSPGMPSPEASGVPSFRRPGYVFAAVDFETTLDSLPHGEIESVRSIGDAGDVAATRLAVYWLWLCRLPCRSTAGLFISSLGSARLAWLGASEAFADPRAVQCVSGTVRWCMPVTRRPRAD